MEEGSDVSHQTSLVWFPDTAHILDVEKPRASDISIHVTSKSLRAEVVRIVGGVDAEIRRFIAAHVAGEIDSPESVQAKVIDVAERLDAAWTGI